MKIGAENRLKLAAASTLAAIALVPLGRLLDGLDLTSVPATTAEHGQEAMTQSRLPKDTSNLNTLDPTLNNRRLELSEGTQYEGTGRNIFRMETPMSRMPGGPRPLSPVLSKSSSPPTSPPTMRLRFFGFARSPGHAKEIFLAEDGDLFVGTEGDIIDRRYKILHITPASVEMQDLINDVRQTLPLEQG